MTTMLAIVCLTTWVAFAVLVLRVNSAERVNAERVGGVLMILIGSTSSAILSALVLFSR